MSFPSTKEEALALLYVQAQDLSGKSPADLLAMYDNVLNVLSELKSENTAQSPPYMGLIKNI